MYSQTGKQTVPDDKPEMDISLGRANLWFIVLWLLFLLDLADRSAVSSVLPLLKKQFGLTDAQSGLVSSILGLSLGLLVLPTAILADKWSRRKIVSIMAATWSLATYFMGVAVGYKTLLLARLGVGGGESGYVPAGNALISAWYPKKMRGTMIGLFYSASQLGTSIGIAAAGYIGYHYGWRWCFGVLAIPGLILAALSWFMPDYKSVEIEKESHATDIWRTLKFILKSPTLVFVYLGSGMEVMVQYTFPTWGVTL